MKLRLLLLEECNRKCKGCCNKGYDLKALPVCTSYEGYDEILLTGGEPLLNPTLIINTVKDIIAQNDTANIYVYTAKTKPAHSLCEILQWVDGLTLTLHTRKDLEPFIFFNDILCDTEAKSLRLNVFRGISLRGIDLSRWIIRKNIKWIKDCPIPQDEVFMRLETI